MTGSLPDLISNDSIREWQKAGRSVRLCSAPLTVRAGRPSHYRDARVNVRGTEDGHAVRPRPGRLEVWYDSVTDPVSGTGFWLHHELVSPTDGSAPYTHGWVAAFPPGEAPLLQRFGPGPLLPGPRFVVRGQS